MNPSMFYEVGTAEGAICLTLCSLQEWPVQQETLSAFRQGILASHQFKGKLGDLGLIPNEMGQLSHVFIGLGSHHDHAAFAHVLNRLPAGRYATDAPLSMNARLNWSLAQYRFLPYQHKEIFPRVLCLNESHEKEVLPLAEAIWEVRDLINTPANDMGPMALGEHLQALAGEFGASYQEWVGDELLRENFPAIHAVGRAAEQAPRLAYLCHGDKEHPHVTLVGKGVTFDSGGLDIKSASNMRLMKKDMGGAAHVIGLSRWIMTQKLPIYLQVYIPAVENAVGSNAYRPGDVIFMRNGLTVEIENTDAEGRLVLADALTKACEDKPELLIDFATLTGAARIAVGTDIAAMFTPDDALAAGLSQASVEMHDPVWRLPLYAGYAHMLDSSVADLMNATSSSYAGAITAALFMERFVKKEVSWVHFDMMAWNLSSKPGKPEGGEAMGLLTVAAYLKQRYLIK